MVFQNPFWPNSVQNRTFNAWNKPEVIKCICKVLIGEPSCKIEIVWFLLFSQVLMFPSFPGLVQVQQSLEKIARLEQEKEHWLLEAQLGKVRLEKENQRIADLEAQLAAALGGSSAAPSAAAGTLTQSHEETEAESRAAEKESTLCTSLVSPCRLLFFERKSSPLVCKWRLLVCVWFLGPSRSCNLT